MIKKQNYKNFRYNLQFKQAKEVKEKFNNEINTYSQYKSVKNYFFTINRNFIQYSGNARIVLTYIQQLIHENLRVFGVECTFRITNTQIAYKLGNKELNCFMSVNTIKSIMNVFCKEGVLKRLDTSKKEGSYYIITTDITKPFDRRNKPDFAIKDTATTPKEEDLQDIVLSEENDNCVLDMSNCSKNNKTSREHNTSLDVKYEVIFQKKQTNTLNKCQEKSYLERATNELLERVPENDKAEVVSLFNEYCDKRRDATGRLLAKKTQRAVEGIKRELIKANTQFNLNIKDCLLLGLEKGWRGLEADWCVNKLQLKFNENEIKKQIQKIQSKEDVLDCLTNTEYGRRVTLKEFTRIACRDKANKMYNNYLEGKERNNISNSHEIVARCFEVYRSVLYGKKINCSKEEQAKYKKILSSRITDNNDYYDYLIYYYTNKSNIKYPLDNDKLKLLKQLMISLKEEVEQKNLRIRVYDVYKFLVDKTNNLKDNDRFVDCVKIGMFDELLKQV